MNNLLTWSFWFNLRPPAMLAGFNYLFIAFLVLLLILSILSAYLKTKKKIYKSFWRKFYDFAAANLIIGLFLFFFNWQEAPFLSARFWLVIWVILIITWLIFLIKDVKKIPKKRKLIEEEKKFNKYLPK